MKERLFEFFKRYDFSFILIMLGIFVLGILNLYSATHNHHSQRMQQIYVLQMVWFFVALLVAIGTSFISSKSFFRSSYFLYFANIFLLILVLLVGEKGMGAQRWIAIGSLRLQPSELMKITLVMALARWFSTVRPDVEMSFRDLIIPGLITIIPAGLIVTQPDLGTGLLLGLIFLMMSFFHRLKWRTISLLVVLGALSGTVMYKYGLKEYQRKRILTFINPQADARGSGYNAIQSEIAIGSGRILGKGFMNSSQASLNFLPENHTDFVFSIFNEEHGFIGSVFLISLYAILFLRFTWLSGMVLRLYDSLFVIGLMAIFFWHTFINMSMVMGLMPIVGLPLPFMSYGGSSLLTFGICIGMATSVSNSRNLF